MPIAATKHTAAGAAAFAKFFIQTIDWGYATTSSTYMSRYYQPSCKQCASVRLFLDNARRDHQHYVGSRLSNLREVKATADGSDGSEYRVRVILDISAVELIDASGHASNPDVGRPGFKELVGTAWREHAWTVVSLAGSTSK